MNINIVSYEECINFKKYSKKYKLISKNNNYMINLESLVKNNQKRLFIKLTHKKMDRDINFYTEKSLEEIFNEITFLSESDYNSINSLIDYFSKLIKSNNITIDRLNNLIYNLYFYDNDKKEIIKFYLKRKIEIGQKNIEEIENEILNMYLSFKNSLNKQEEEKTSSKNFDVNKFKINTFSLMINNINPKTIKKENILKLIKTLFL